MRRSLVLAAAMLLAAGPLAGQQQAPPADVAEPVATPAAQSAEVESPRAPTLHVSVEQIDAQLRAEPELDEAQVGSSSFFYTVAAVALGVLIALLLID